MSLRGIRVVDLSRLAPGPYATRLLAELGAEIIKIEAPGVGDFTRVTPPLAGDPPTGGVFREMNAGKRSVALDLKTDDGRAALRALLKGADVLVDGNRPGVLARLGFDPRELMATHPKLIYCAITGFGLTGPDAQRAGHDIGYLTRAGAQGLSGPAETPVTHGIQVADIGASLVAVSGILAALYERTNTGKGKVVDVSLMEASLGLNVLNFGNHHAGGTPRRGDEMLDGSRPGYGVYRTKDDRFLAVGALEPKFWMRFCEAIGVSADVDAGLAGGDRGRDVRQDVQAKLQERTRDEWMSIFREVDCCIEPIFEVDEVESDPHFIARHSLDESGVVRSPIRVSDWGGVGGPREAALSPSPALGEHTREVLTDAGVDPAIIDRLSKRD